MNQIFNTKAVNNIFKMLQQKKLHNSIIFYGESGIGKFNCAYVLCKFILSHNIQDFYNKSSDFFSLENIDYIAVNLINKKVNENFFLLDKTSNLENKTNTITVDNVRELITFIQKPSNSIYKTVIINTLDLLNTNANNALLKILEDTPSNTVFFLITNNYNNILETIKSRSIAFKFLPLNDEQLNEYALSNNINFKDDQKDIIFKLSNGSYERLNWFANEENILLYKKVINAIVSKKDYYVLQLKPIIDKCDNIEIIFNIVENYVYRKINSNNYAIINTVLQEWLNNKNLCNTIYLDKFSILSNFIFKLHKIL